MKVKRILSVLLCVLLLAGTAPGAGFANWFQMHAAAGDPGVLYLNMPVFTYSNGVIRIFKTEVPCLGTYFYDPTTFRLVYDNDSTYIEGEYIRWRISKTWDNIYKSDVMYLMPSTWWDIPDTILYDGTDVTEKIWEYNAYTLLFFASAYTPVHQVVIDRSITKIDTTVFTAYWSLPETETISSIIVDEDNPFFCSDENGVLYNKDRTAVLRYPPVHDPNDPYVIPDTVKSIEDDAFYHCAHLAEITDKETTRKTSLTLPDSVTSIGRGSFLGCTSLKDVTIPDSVTSIGDDSFSECSNLETVTIGSGLTSIGEDAFYGCTSLRKFIVDRNNPVFSSDSNGILYNKDKTAVVDSPGGTLTVLILPNTVKTIQDSAFDRCPSLTRVVIPDSVTSIGDHAFSDCPELTRVKIGNGVKSIEESAFANCAKLASVTLGSGVTSIGETAFYGCTGLTSIHIPSGVTDINQYAFFDCDNLEYICCNTEDCYAKTFAEAQGIEFRVCEGHEEEECQHDYASAVTTEPTCTATGVRTYTCSLCGDSYTEVISASGHAYESAVTTEPTCAAEGVRTYTCTRCTDSYTEVIDKIAHTPQTVTEPATCTEDGKQYDKCGVCGETVGDVTVLPMLGHDFGEWVTVTEPTTEAEGLQERTCTRCGEKETQALPKIQTKTVGDTDSGITLTYPENAYAGDVQLNIKQVLDGAAFTLVEANSEKSAVYDVTTTVNGVAVQPNGKVTVRIPVPAGFDGAKCVVYHVAGGKLEKMNARYENGYMVFETGSFSVYAVVIEKAAPPTVAIRNFTENKTVDYRATVTFTADVTNGVSGGAVHWFVDGRDVGTGETYTVKEAKKSYTVQAKYMKGTDVLAETGTENVTVRTGFFARLKAFFRALFGRLPKEAQAYLGVEFIERLLP